MTSTTVVETRSNKMIFNLLTPQGFISLSDYGTKSVDDPRDSDSHDDERFPLGRMVVTANADNILSADDINTAIERHKGRLFLLSNYLNYTIPRRISKVFFMNFL